MIAKTQLALLKTQAKSIVISLGPHDDAPCYLAKLEPMGDKYLVRLCASSLVLDRVRHTGMHEVLVSLSENTWAHGRLSIFSADNTLILEILEFAELDIFDSPAMDLRT